MAFSERPFSNVFFPSKFFYFATVKWMTRKCTCKSLSKKKIEKREEKKELGLSDEFKQFRKVISKGRRGKKGCSRGFYVRSVSRE